MKREQRINALIKVFLILLVPIITTVLTFGLLVISKTAVVNNYHEATSPELTYIYSIFEFLTSNLIFLITNGLIILILFALFIKSIIKPLQMRQKKILAKKFAVAFFVFQSYLVILTFPVIISSMIIPSDIEARLDQIIETAKGENSDELVETDKNAIIEYVENNSDPEIKFNNAGLSKTVIFNEINMNSGYGKLYIGLLTEKAKNLEVNLGLEEISIFLYQDNLYINDINDDYEEVYEILGKTLVKEYQRDKNSDAANVNVLTRDEYVEKRQAEIDGLIKEYDDYIAELKATLEDLKETLAKDEAMYNQYGGAMWASWVAEDKEWIATYEAAIADWEDWRERIAARKTDALTELGEFVQPKDIDIVIADSEYYPSSLYMGTLVHEYFHYISNDNELYIHDFFEESVTEYLTEKVLDEKLGLTDHGSYANVVPIMAEIMNDVGEDKVLDLYFAKDETGFENLLNQTYGADFWKNYENKLYHATFMYDDEAYAIVDEVMGIIK